MRVHGKSAAWLLLSASLVVACGPPRSVYRGGPILTMDPQNRVVAALGIEGDRIRAVGSEAEVMAWAGDHARIVELHGHALLPGFMDAHSHYPGAGIFSVVEDLNSPPLGSVESIDELVARLARRAARTDPGEWVVGMGYDDTLLREKRHPTRADLDRVSTQHPVGILHISGHMAVVNSRGLEELGIDANTPDPEGGRIVRDPASGAPTGLLQENAMQALQKRLLSPSAWDAWKMVRTANRLYLASGTTTAQMGYADPTQMRAMGWLSRLGLIPLRLVMWPGMETADEMLAGKFRFHSYDDAWVRVGAVKLIADGSIQGYTGYLSKPYFVPPGDDPSYRGFPRISREELIRRVKRYHAAGMQIAIHGNGDAAIDDILDAYAEAQTEHPRPDARDIIVHAQMARPDQLDRMKKLGVIPSFFSLHTYYWGDRHRDIFMGPERAARMSPAHGAVERGLIFTIHCDTPVVPMEPLRLVWSAVNRLSSSGQRIGAAERITPMQALRAVTINVAYQYFEEKQLGSLEPGKLADLVILSESPLDVPERIDRIRVLQTLIGGKSVYRATP